MVEGLSAALWPFVEKATYFGRRLAMYQNVFYNSFQPTKRKLAYKR